MTGEEGESEIICIFTENHRPITPSPMLSSFSALCFTYSDDNAVIRHGIAIFLSLLLSFLRRSVQVKVTLLAGLSYKLANSALSMFAGKMRCHVESVLRWWNMHSGEMN